LGAEGASTGQQSDREGEAMKTQAHCSLRATCGVAAVLLAVAIGASAAGCQSLRSRVSSSELSCEAVLHEAIRTRGGPLSGFIRLVEARVHLAFPGVWRLESSFLVPDYYRWTVFTTDEPDHYIWDGKQMESYVGTALVARDASPDAPLRSHARWVAVTNLDALLDPRWAERISCAGHRVGTDVVLDIVFADDGSRYSLRFDQGRRLSRAEGPAALPPLAAVRINAEYRDFRVVGGRLVARSVSYRVDGKRLMDERLLSLAVNPPDLGPGSFRPPGLPTRAWPFTAAE
jgi:hypothetical protein